MKLKLIILSLLASNLVYANGLKIISHEVTHITWAEHLALLKKAQTKNSMCTAYADPANVSSEQNVVVNGKVSYVINNTTEWPQNYWVNKDMCVVEYGCTHVRDSVSLDGNETGSGEADIFNTEYLKKGTYEDQATIQIEGESNCFAQDSNKVTVY